MNKDSLSLRLKEERSRSSYQTQYEIAKTIGVTRETWSKFERGITEPNAEILMKLNSLGFDVYYILTGEKLAYYTQDEINLITARRNLDIEYILDDLKTIIKKHKIFETTDN
jgi:transcriptional regulator with XRE-family HTH domain